MPAAIGSNEAGRMSSSGKWGQMRADELQMRNNMRTMEPRYEAVRFMRLI
jgi:hypothetical protein